MDVIEKIRTLAGTGEGKVILALTVLIAALGMLMVCLIEGSQYEGEDDVRVDD